MHTGYDSSYVCHAEEKGECIGNKSIEFYKSSHTNMEGSMTKKAEDAYVR